MFMCAGNLKPENFPGYLGFLKGLEYGKGITEWIAHSVWLAVATLVLQVPGTQVQRRESGTGCFLLAIVFLDPDLAKEIVERRAFQMLSI